MNNRFFFLIMILLLINVRIGICQNQLTLNEVLVLAKSHSLDYQESKNNFLAQYWAFKKYKLALRPQIRFNVSPFSINRSIAERYDFENNIEVFRESRTMSSSSGIYLSQKIPFSGGNLSLRSSISRIENFGDARLTSYSTTPVSISYSQPIFTHNAYRWEKQELPLKLKKAKLSFLQAAQELSKTVSQNFFNLLKAHQLYELASQEVLNADTLYKTGITLLSMSEITPDHLLELEIKRLNARIFLNKQKQNLADATFEMNTQLNGYWPVSAIPIINDTVPEIILNSAEVLEMVRHNNPIYIQIKQEQINLEKTLDRAKKVNKFSANINVSMGLNQVAQTITGAYTDPCQQQTGSVSLSIPVINWGADRGDYIIAKKDKELAEQRLKSKLDEFEQDIINKCMQQSLNYDAVIQTAMVIRLAVQSHSNKLEEFKLGNITLQELNQSQTDLLKAKEDQIESIAVYWDILFELQKQTLCNLIIQEKINYDFEVLISSLK